MILDKIASNKYITIQCHDNPDADTIAAGYGLYLYFSSLGGHHVDLIYSGREKINKMNLNLMIDRLDIPLRYVDEMHYESVGILVTVDSQYGSGNITKLRSNKIAVIDHHQPGPLPDDCLRDIRPTYGSCSTVVWKLLRDKEFPIDHFPFLETALYYGLYNDTTSFYELYQPEDREMHDSLNPDIDLIRVMNNSNLTAHDLELAGLALTRAVVNVKKHFAVLRADHCDTNILGMISDFALQVDCIYTCIVYSERSDVIKFSVRSCVKEIHANELAAFVSHGIGNGGGHLDKAGGTIKNPLECEEYQDQCLVSFFSKKIKEYLSLHNV